MIQSNCLQTGELRWAVQYEPRLRTFPDLATQPPQQMIGLADGGVIVQTAEAGLIRVAHDGTPAAARYETQGTVIALAEGCGALVERGDPSHDEYQWWSLDDFATTATLPGFLALPADSPSFMGEPSVLADCSVVWARSRHGPPAPDGTYARITEMVGLDAHGQPWQAGLPDGQVGQAATPLADGGFVVIQHAPFRLSVLEATGAVRWTRAYDIALGEYLVPNATVLLPDGVLYALTTPGPLLRSGYHLLAVDIGAAPARLAWRASGANWARTGTTLPPAPPRQDGGVAPGDAGLDAGLGPIDGGTDVGG